MPRFLAPHKSGAHRVAAIALYRALITQAARLTLEDEKKIKAREIVRRRFRDARYVTSTRRLKVLFAAGYEGVDVLDGCVAGDAAERGRVMGLLDLARVEKEGTREEEAVVVEEEEETREKERLDMFSRPLPKEKLTGKRNIPVLVNANHIPFLRFTKPQPRSLSLYLHSRIKQRQKRHDVRMRLEDALVLARAEDRWDAILGVGESGRKWEASVREGLEVVRGKLERERESNRVMSGLMQGVVDAERECAEREEEEEREGNKSEVG